ncbi:hypothetical protein ACWM9A_16175 [Acetobacter pasteurianus]|uniref:DUF559 domain-containing protein n=1 Tax=Acetobacter pasteurianus TaxID=438 RepID=A0A1A0DLD8_ACEPA|nr:hypothetical protein [Acetobacter pasteurianus]OAZ75681.1 hypothetical protein SRCM100623_00354 [Acetobacter pasteurianus]
MTPALPNNDRFNNALPAWMFAGFFRPNDIERYAQLSHDLLVTPTQQMLEFCDGGHELVARYNRDRALWRAFRQRVAAYHRDLPAWQEQVRVNNYRIGSIVELAVYRRLLQEQESGLTIMVQPPIRELGNRGFADFGLYFKGHPTVYIEVAGTVTSTGRSVSENAEKFRIGIEERLMRYMGVAPVEVIHIDEVCDVSTQTERVRQAIERAKSA